MPKKKDTAKKIVVTGDVAVDWLEVLAPPPVFQNSGSKNVLNYQIYNLVKHKTLPGGALLLAKFIRAATRVEVLSPELKNLEGSLPDKVIHSFISLDKFPQTFSKKDEENTYYRVNKFKGFYGPADDTPPCLPIENDDLDADIVVIDDAGNGFRDTKTVWPAALQKGKRPIVVIKMSRPLAKGALWAEIQNSHAQKTVLVISADDLRQMGVNISRRISWERTAKDFVWQMASNPSLLPLSNCAYLVVRFGIDGAILYRRREGVVKSILFYDPEVEEDGFAQIFPGDMQGLNSAFVTPIVSQICQSGLDGIAEGIRWGIQSARRLCLCGFGQKIEELDYPVTDIFSHSDGSERVIYDVVIPNPTAPGMADPEYWCIMNEMTKNGIEDMAFKYVISGKDSEFSGIPLGKFRNLKTFDRSEIESYRSIRNLIREYLNFRKMDQPLSIAVFGKPGSGKSFGVTEVAESVAPDEIEKLEFNLSQFRSTEDLIAAFHKVRDIALRGKVPLVFFDEFDCNFNVHLGWLRQFIAPMQDGKFREGDAAHPIGKTIFVFAGGTYHTFEKFCQCGQKEKLERNKEQNSSLNDVDETEESAKFKNAKGVDFVSRLRGFVDIKGPDQVNEDDRFYKIRRALFLRFQLQEKAKHLFDRDGKCAIDEGVLRAFIKIPSYEHGVRSMTAIIEMSVLSDRKIFEQAALPPPKQLEMHVDADLFYRLAMRDTILGGFREALAKLIHEKFRKEHKDEKPPGDPSMAPWDELREDFKESNRQQADHFPIYLKAIGCDFAPVAGRKPVLLKFTKKEIEVMAEMEHNRFVSERFLQGWSLGPRNPEKKISPYLVEWEKIPPTIQDYDRIGVKAIPELLAKAGFEIYRLKEDTKY